MPGTASAASRSSVAGRGRAARRRSTSAPCRPPQRASRGAASRIADASAGKVATEAKRASASGDLVLDAEDRVPIGDGLERVERRGRVDRDVRPRADGAGQIRLDHGGSFRGRQLDEPHVA